MQPREVTFEELVVEGEAREVGVEEVVASNSLGGAWTSTVLTQWGRAVDAGE